MALWEWKGQVNDMKRWREEEEMGVSEWGMLVLEREKVMSEWVSEWRKWTEEGEEWVSEWVTE